VTLTAKGEWVEVAELNPPALPDMTHLALDHRWKHVLVTDNPFGQVRVSPFAYAARITHDVPDVRPTVVVSTRDRNILAIESEVRGALMNGVSSFLVVVGDTFPEVDHWANHYEIVEHLRRLQEVMPAFEVGMTTRFKAWQFRRRVEVGAQFLVAGPCLDPDSVEPCLAQLKLREEDPPVFVGVVPPFSPEWIARLEARGAVQVGSKLKAKLQDIPAERRREAGWNLAGEVAARARDAGASGAVLMGLKFTTLVGEATRAWHSSI
jgi:5,10-methylenetetrahydrofolate reductase